MPQGHVTCTNSQGVDLNIVFTGSICITCITCITCSRCIDCFEDDQGETTFFVHDYKNILPKMAIE